MFDQALTAVLDAGHAARFVARGDSMYPSIRDGDAIRVQPCDGEPLSVGDIVLAKAARGLTAHRVVRVREREGTVEITTRGDNCLRPDPPLPRSAILGRVVGVEPDRPKMRFFDDSMTLFRLSGSTFGYWRAAVRRLL